MSNGKRQTPEFRHEAVRLALASGAQDMKSPPITASVWFGNNPNE